MRDFLRVTGVLAIAFALSACGPRTPFSIEEDETRLTLSENGYAVLVLNHGKQEPPPGAGGTPRSGYVHPLFDPDGVPLTDDFPADHIHHRGVFFAWPEMTVLGEAVDFWHLRGIIPSFQALGPREVNATTASFELTTDWRLGGADGPAAIREHLRYIVHTSDASGRIIDVHGTFTNLTAEPLSIGGKEGARSKGYGGFNIRIDGTRPDVIITANHGPIQGNIDILDPPSPWADHSSRPAPGRPHSGVAVFQHPANPGYPFPNWTLRPYGFLGAAWPGVDNHTINPGESFDLRYRLYVHRGDPDDARVAERFEQFIRETAH